MKNRISMALTDPILQQGFEIICKNLVELEKEISILLSCKNCPENKGGYICAKEYENKCLAQKIEFIKELQEENAELKSENQKWKDEWQEQVQKANDEGYARTLQTMQLTKAKEIIKNLVEFDSSYKDDEEYQRKSELYDKMWEEAEQFIKDSEVEK